MPRSIWPPSFPQIPLVDGYAENQANNTRSAKTDAGPSKVRLKAGTAPDHISATILFDGYEQYQDFHAWFNNKTTGLAGGVMCFDYMHPLTGKTLTIRLAPMSDDSFFSAAPYRNAASVWAVTLNMEIMP